MPKKYMIRSPATDKEWKEYYALRYELLRKSMALPPETAHLDDDDSAIQFAAFTLDGSEMIGVMRLSKLPNLSPEFNKCPTMQLRMMAVKENWQGKGVGRELVAHVEQYASACGVYKIMLESRDSAVDFYSKLGFKTLKKSHLLYNTIQHFTMELEL